jgi:hypothetical protein
MNAELTREYKEKRPSGEDSSYANYFVMLDAVT